MAEFGSRMQKWVLVVLAVALAGMARAGYVRPMVFPQPKSIEFGKSTFILKDCIQVVLEHDNSEFLGSLQSLYETMFFRKHSSLGFGRKCSLTLNIEIEHPETMMPQGFDPKNEMYTLRISESGKVSIQSKYQVGVLRAMDTLSQLFDRSGTDLKLPFLPLDINDEPRYGYRGLMLDVSRAFYPMGTLKKIIDGLKMTKINVLHLHITDDDTIPLKLPSFPGMTDYTAFTPEDVYTPENMEELIDYARERGVKIIPEFDVPGHTRALGDDPRYTHLMTCLNLPEPWPIHSQGVIHGGPARAVLNPTLEETYDFVETFISDLAKIFSESDFIHLGGDEVLTAECWEQNNQIKQYMTEHGIQSGGELFHYFQTRIGEFAQKSDKTTAHWVYDDNFSLKWDQGSILEYWGDAANTPKFKEAYPDHKHILAVHDYFYFDCGLGNRYGTDLCNPFQTWAKVRTFEV